MTPTDLLLIGLIVLVLLLVYYFMGRKRAPIEIPQEIAVAALKPPKRPLEIFIDPNVGSRVKIVSLSTVEELDKVLDDIVEVNMADRNAINEEATKLEERIIADQKDNVQDLKTASEIIVVEKKEELSASQKLLAEMMKRKEKKIQERELLLQKQRAAAYALDREKNRIENEKKLAEIKLKRQQVTESKKQATIKGEAERMNLAAENERLLLEARNKAEQDLIKTEEEAVEAEKMMREKSVQLAMEEAQAQEDLEAEREKYAELQMQYKLTRQAEQDKIDAAMEELDVMLEEETARKVKMEEEDERIRAEQKQKLLDANAAAVAELEEAEAEQAKIDADAKEIRDKLDAEMQVREGEQRSAADLEKSEYDKKTAADQAALDALQDQSNRTGDSEQQSERDAALALEASSKKDWANMTAAEKQRDIDKRAEWDAAGITPAYSAPGGNLALNAANRLAAMGAIPSSMDPAEHKRCLDAANAMNSNFYIWQHNLDSAYASVGWYAISGVAADDPKWSRANRNKYKDHYHTMKRHLQTAQKAFANMSNICSIPNDTALQKASNWSYLQEAVTLERSIKDARLKAAAAAAAEHERKQREAAAAAARFQVAYTPSPPPPPPNVS